MGGVEIFTFFPSGRPYQEILLPCVPVDLSSYGPVSDLFLVLADLPRESFPGGFGMCGGDSNPNVWLSGFLITPPPKLTEGAFK